MTRADPAGAPASDLPVEGFSPLEGELLGSDGAQALAARLAWVAETRSRLTAWLDTGVTQADHAEGRLVLAALDAAERILKTNIHKGQENQNGRY